MQLWIKLTKKHSLLGKRGFGFDDDSNPNFNEPKLHFFYGGGGGGEGGRGQVVRSGAFDTNKPKCGEKENDRKNSSNAVQKMVVLKP